MPRRECSCAPADRGLPRPATTVYRARRAAAETRNREQKGEHMRIDLTGRVAVVSGASAGIGRAIAEGLAEAGAHVVVGSRRGDAIEQAAAEIAGKTGRRTVGVAADVAHPDGVQRLLGAAADAF